MGRDSLVSFEQVCAAAANILARGDRPSTRAVHELIGVGSMSTIVRHMQTWRGERNENAGLSEPPLDTDFLRATNILIRKKTTEAIADAELRVNELQRDVSLLLKENENLTEQLTKQAAEISSQNSKLQMCLARIELLNNSNDRMKSELDQEIQSRQQMQLLLAKAEQRVESFPAILVELQNTKSELVHARDVAAEFRGRFAGLIGTQEHRTIHDPI